MFVPEDQTVPPGLPVLVSFPRTGSHWLRMFLELYFDRPLLSRHFFAHERTDPLLVHVHDDDLDHVPSGPVIYLYRGPVDTVFSELTYRHGERAPDLPWADVREVAERYRRHLRRWLVGGDVPEPRAVVTYEWLLDEPLVVLTPVIIALGGEIDRRRFDVAWDRVDPQLVRERTGHDPRVIDRTAQKELRRALFRYRHGPEVLAHFREDDVLRRQMHPRVLEMPPRTHVPRP